METRTYLSLKFISQEGRTVTLNVQEPREDILEQEVKDAMDLIVARDLFTSNSGDLVSADSAVLITRTEDEILNEDDFLVQE